MLQRGMASGKRVDLHIIVNKNLFPDFVFGRGPTQSIRISPNSSPHTGTGFNGATGIG